MNLGVVEGIDQWSGGAEGVSADRNVVGLPDQEDEVQVQIVGNGAQAQTHVGGTGGDGDGDFQVGVQLGAGDVVVGDVVVGDAGSGEQLVEEYPGAGPDLPLGDSQLRQVSGGADTAGITRYDEQTLFAPPQVQQVRATVPEQGRDRSVRGHPRPASIAHSDHSTFGQIPVDPTDGGRSGGVLPSALPDRWQLGARRQSSGAHMLSNLNANLEVPGHG